MIQAIFFFLVIPGLEWRIVIMTRVSCVGDHTLYIKKRKKKKENPFPPFQFFLLPMMALPIGCECDESPCFELFVFFIYSENHDTGF
jgi:hypothetical protein